MGVTPAFVFVAGSPGFRGQVRDGSVGGPESLDLATIETFYRRYGETVLHRCRRLLNGDEDSAWDAMHQTFIRAIKYRGTFRGGEPIGWLYSIAFRVCMDQLATQARQRPMARVDAAEIAALDAAPDDLGSFSAQLDRQRIVARLLPRFDAKVQQIVVLRFFDGMEVAEIAAATGASEPTVARRLSAFKKRARKLVERER